jgi:ribosome assembly protein YihI (activator of Der GTPase)
MEDQRRVASLPKKQDATLPSNRLNAKKLLNSLMERLENNEALKHHDHMLNYITRAVPA